MRRYILLLVSTLLMLYSCVKEKDCPNASIVLLLIGYQGQETNNLQLSKYKEGSDFTDLISTSVVNNVNALYYGVNDTTTIRFYNDANKVQEGNDWIIRIPSTNQEIRFRQFKYDKRRHTVPVLGLSMDRFPDYCQSPIRSIIIDNTLVNFLTESAVITLKK